ncbi:MAG TPA: MraY family glycosyltransferase [Candidatus Limnocylindrales bacterium]|nr:MraY family glycosyltransferase [Candidatus Limnocylindrales bacterium]
MRTLDDLIRLGPLLALAFVSAAVLAFALTPAIRSLAIRFGFVDHPDDRRVNTRPVPRAGGLAVAGSFLIVASLATIAALGDLIDVRVGLESGQIAALLVGGALAAVIGLLDDVFQLRARWQMLGQVGIALFAVGLGIDVAFVANPFGEGIIPFHGWVAVGFTVFWIAGMINSINFIDGLDGLSSGIGLIAALTLAVISLTAAITQPLVAVYCLALAGALLGFLRWNFHPAAIFAGTSGTMFLGYTLALLAILGTAKVAVALLVLGVPILDTFWIIVRRLASGRPPFSPDRGHIHHRLLDLGLSHTQTVVLIYVLCAALAAMSLVLTGADQIYAFVGLGLVFGFALLLLARATGEDSFEADAYEPTQPGDAEPARAPAPTRAVGPGRAEAAIPLERTEYTDPVRIGPQGHEAGR